MLTHADVNTLRADAAASTMDKATQKTLQALTDSILTNMEEGSLAGDRAGDCKFLANLHRLAQLRWQGPTLLSVALLTLLA
jgi:hypothetical protein